VIPIKNEKIIKAWDSVNPDDRTKQKMLANINNSYEQRRNAKNPKPLKYAFAAALCVFAILLFTSPFDFTFFGTGTKTPRLTLSVSAQELGLEDYVMIGNVPIVIYADQSLEVLYDYRGIYVFSFDESALVGFCDFRDIHMTQLEGDNPTIVEINEQGTLIRIYNNTDTYLYDVTENARTAVQANDSSAEFECYEIESIYPGAGSDDSLLEASQPTYFGKDDSITSVVLDFSDEETVKYEDLYILKKEGNEIVKYKLFQ